jgi:outer membrane protein TolC
VEQKVVSIQNELTKNLEKVLYELKESNRQIQLYQNVLIPKGLESLGATEKAYRSDKIDFLSLVDAQRRLLKFQMKYEKAFIDYLKAKSKLSVLTGEKIS